MASQAECARTLGIGRRWFADLLDQGVITRQSAGQYDVPTVVQEYLAHLRSEDGAPVGPDDRETLEEARCRKMTADATLAELEVQKSRGQLVEVELVQAEITEEYTAVRARLLSLPTKLAPLVVAASGLNEVKNTIEAGITEALNELSGSQSDGSAASSAAKATKSAGRGKGGRSKAPAKADDKPVGRREKAAKPRSSSRAGKVADKPERATAGGDGRNKRSRS